MKITTFFGVSLRTSPGRFWNFDLNIFWPKNGRLGVLEKIAKIEETPGHGVGVYSWPTVSQPKETHNEEAYVIFDKSTPLFPKGGLSRIFFIVGPGRQKPLSENFRCENTNLEFLFM